MRVIYVLLSILLFVESSVYPVSALNTNQLQLLSIKVCIPDNNVLPFYDVEGDSLSGLTVKHLTLLFAQPNLQSYKLSFLPAPWKRCLNNVQNGTADVVVVGLSEDREQFIVFPNQVGFDLERSAFNTTKVCLVKRKSDSWQWDGKAFIGTDKIVLGLEAGFQRTGRGAASTRLIYKPIWDAKKKYQLLSKSRVDAVLTVCGLRDYQYSPDAQLISNDLQVLTPAYIKSNVYLGFSKRFFSAHPNAVKDILNTSNQLDPSSVYLSQKSIL